MKLLRANGGFYKLPMAWASDNISANIAAQKSGIANTQTITFQYRVNQKSISTIGDIAIKLEAIKQEKKWYRSFLSVIPDDEQDKKIQKILQTLYVTQPVQLPGT